MIYAELVLRDARERFITLIAEREGVDRATIIPLSEASPQFTALCEALVDAINKELAK